MYSKMFKSVLCIVLFGLISAEAGRVFDVPDMPMESLFTEAGANVTVPCPGVTEFSLVLQLEWRCRGCSQGSVISGGSGTETKLVESSREVTTVWENRNRMTLLSDNSLHFHPIIADDSGDYTCLVNNRPKPEAIVQLVVQDVPDPPGRPLIMGFTSRLVNLSWAPSQDTHNSPILYYIIHVRVGEDGDWDATKGINTVNNDTLYQVTELRPFTVYSFRVVAVNAMGRSRPSKESYYMVTLREVPDGKPTITTAHNTSATSLHISWRAPHRDTIHGEFLGYRIAYRPRDKGVEFIKEIYIRDPNVESHTIQNLETYSQYLVSLQVFNPEGPGPSTTVLVMTDEGVPSKPRNVSVVYIGPRAMTMTWIGPERPNGAITGYRIYYMHRNYTDVVKSIPMSQISPVYFNLTGLQPNTDYKIWVQAYTWKSEGETSEPVDYHTDVSGPGAPKILNLTCLSHDTLFLHWQRPTEFFKSIDFYLVSYRSEDLWGFQDIFLETSLEKLEESVFIPNLTNNVMYEIKVRGAARSIYDKSVLQHGIDSESRKILVQNNCDKIAIVEQRNASDLNAGMVAGVVCVAVAIIFAIIAFIIWRTCFRDQYNYLDNPPPLPPPVIVEWDIKAASGVPNMVPVAMFAAHVMKLHADGDIGFSKEYEAIQAASTQEEYSAEHSQHPDNKAKNRYLNILAYDHTRVMLQSFPGTKKVIDYINANFIDGYHQTRAYIGTQGPLVIVFECFWRMIWEQNVVIIVMITNLVERGRRKCDMYWPKDGVETYGVIQVTLIREDIMATYTVRTFQIRHLRLKKKKNVVNERIVKQYHYTNWPDHGTPDHPLPVLSFVKKSAAANPPDAGPIIVHCSAGVGRTGTYIVLDAMLKQIRAKQEVNIFGFLRHIRTQRNFLVQTEEQYIFIHDALLEAIECGETNIGQNFISHYLNTLQSPETVDDKLEPWKLLETQFKLLTAFQPMDFNLVSAMKPCNQAKNRSFDLVPIESARVHLTPKPGVDGSDYINASWIQGFNKLREFIITQHPGEATMTDFWQMVWDHNTQIIVIVCRVEDQNFGIFWPTLAEELEAENFKVKFVDETELPTHTTRDFTVQSLQDDYELSVRMIHCSNWPHTCNNVSSVFDLVNTVQEWHREYQNGPIIVVDRYGGTEAATFCALTTLSKQLEYENSVDVYMYAKLYHNKRPGIWKSQEDYLYLYQCLESLAGKTSNQIPPPPPAPDIYLTVNGHLNGYVGNGNGHLLNSTSSNGVLRIPPEGMECLFAGKESIA